MNRLIPAALLATLSLLGCSESKPAETPAAKPAPAAAPKAAEAPKADATAAAAAPASDAKAEAMQVFQSRCVVCHGANGKGDGPTAAALNPKPRDYTDVEWQKSVTDEQLAKAIVEGGAAVGKSPLMPPNPDLAAKKDVVDALVAHIRSFAK